MPHTLLPGFWSLPEPLQPTTSISITEFMHSCEHTAWPNHLRRRERSTLSISARPVWQADQQCLYHPAALLGLGYPLYLQDPDIMNDHKIVIG